MQTERMPPPAPPGLPHKVIAVIPARLASQRLPHKVLRHVGGRPLLAWVYEAASACPQFAQVIIAVDALVTAQLCEQNGWPWRMTSPDLASGTDRLAVISQEVDADVYVNVQGDEPLLEEAHIAALLRPFHDASVDVTTLRTRCAPHEVDDPNAVKVVTSLQGRALYFSRAPIPFHRDSDAHPVYWKHLGLYAYRKTALQQFAALPPATLEQTERLEQLRLLENGFSLHVQAVDQGTIGVDTEEDLQKVGEILRIRQAKFLPGSEKA